MDKAKILLFPVMRPAQVVNEPSPKRCAVKLNARKVLRGSSNILLLGIMILNRPLSLFLNAVFGFYSLAWLYSSSGFHAAVALIAFCAAVLLKCTLLMAAKKAR